MTATLNKDPSPKALVLMATFNGRKYLRTQVESILAQRDAGIYLLVRDDGSDDGTKELLLELAEEKQNISIVSDLQGRLGHVGNFERLLERARHTEFDYFLLSDQDDLWSPHKAIRQLSAIKKTEQKLGQLPLLCHSDMLLIDSEGKRLGESFLTHVHRRHQAPPLQLPALLTQNFVTGCAMAFNRSLIEIALPFPSYIQNHDHWLALCASAYGEICFEPIPLVSYRQHGANAIGASNLLPRVLSRPLATLGRIRVHIEYQARLAELATDLVTRDTSLINNDAAELLEKVIEVVRARSCSISRIRALRELRIWPDTSQNKMIFCISQLMSTVKSRKQKLVNVNPK